MFKWGESRTYEGEWFEGKMQGKGKLITQCDVYEGDFLNDHMEGYGVLSGDYLSNTYRGYWK